MKATIRNLFVAAVVLALIFLANAAPAAAADCDLVASPEGSDQAAGTADAPFAGAAKLAKSLSSGQTGCLRGGNYSADNEVKLTAPNSTLTSFPGERAKITARIYVAQPATGATIRDLDLNGVNSNRLPSPTVNATDTKFIGNDVTNDHTGICFNLGHIDWGSADRALIADNKIHDCGRLPATNQDHGIYVSLAKDVVIRDNKILDNADRGIQLYPNAQDATVTGNVIDGNGVGVIISGDESTASSGNVVEGNLITNSTIRNNVESHWPGPVGTGNIVRHNCIYGGARDQGNGGILSLTKGFEAIDNITSPGAECDQMLGGSGGQVQLTIKTNRRKVKRGNRIAVMGLATNVDEVAVEIQRRSTWKVLRTKRAPGKHYRTRVKLKRAGRTKLRVSAEGETSSPVKIKVKRNRRNR